MVCFSVIGALPDSMISDLTASGSSGGMPNSLLPVIRAKINSLLLKVNFMK